MRTRRQLTRMPWLAPVAAACCLWNVADATVRPAPDWVKKITPGTWAEVSLNTLADLNPARDPEVNPNYPASPPWIDNQRAVLDAWNGGAFAAGYGQSGALIVFGGGHTDYYGNEVYAFDLASQRWERLTNPYPNPVFPVKDGIWPDGTPSVPHTYDHVDYHPATNSFIVMRTEYDNIGWTSSPVVGMFSLNNLKPPDTNANRNLNRRNWRFSPVHTDDFSNVGGWSAYDSQRDLFWINGGAGTKAFASFDPNPPQQDGRYGVFRSFEPRLSVTDSVATYDPVNDIVLVTVFRNSPTVLGIDLTRPGTGTAGNTTLMQSGAPPALEHAHGWEWSPTRRAFIYYRRGAGVFEFKQKGLNWRTDPWKWSDLTAPDNTVRPASDSRNGVYGRFRIASFADAEIALIVTQVNGPVYAFRIPEGETRREPRSPTDLKAR